MIIARPNLGRSDDDHRNKIGRRNHLAAEHVTQLNSSFPEREEHTDSSLSEENLILEEKYDLSAVLGKGGMAKVWRARDQELQRPVALKVMQNRSKRNSVDRENFVIEARVTAQLQHPELYLCTHSARR